MATATQTDIAVTDDWTNLVVTNATLASVDVAIQNKPKSREPVFVVWGGSKPTDSNAGFLVNGADVITGNAAAIWVRSAAPGEVGVVLL